MIRTAILSVPRIEPHRPPAGPAIIAQVCKNVGHDVTCYDLNIELFHVCKSQNFDYHGLDSVWDQISEPSDAQEKLLATFIESWTQKLSQENFDNILISVFGSSGRYFAERFLKQLRPLTSARIAAGGMGILYTGLKKDTDCFGEKLRQAGLIDDYFTGEGEQVVADYFQGKTDRPGINNNIPHQIEDLDSLPWPNYSFFDLDKYDYLYPGQKDIFITGSRGCVRKCTYCDIERYWPKFRYRSGQNIADEIIHNYETHGVTKFYFTDSLVNGSLKAFNDMCNKLSRYKFDQPISWSGQFIFRPKKGLHDEHFAMIKAAGGDLFFVGIETGSDRVRFEIGKKFTNEDIDYQFEQFSKNRIQVIPLMFTGYVTEKIEDHKMNLEIFPRWQRYVADGTIVGWEMGSNLIVLPGSPVERMIDEYGLEFMNNEDGEPEISLWRSAVNPDLTVYERVRRKLELHEQAIKYAYPVWRQAARLNTLKHFILKSKLDQTDVEKKFFPIKVA